MFEESLEDTTVVSDNIFESKDKQETFIAYHSHIDTTLGGGERKINFDPKEIWYVVDGRQSLHFEQVFRAARKAELVDENTKFFINPTGRFVIGGPNGDSGLTGRKIIVDTYGGMARHGGGAFSGKDCTKVDRSAAYAARHIAKNLVASGACDEALVQIAYAIGVAQPVGFYVNTNGTAHVKAENGKKMSDAEIAERLKDIFDLRPYSIVKRFGLKNPIFEPTASYGHFGRDCRMEKVEVFYEDKDTFKEDGKIYKNVEFYAWEKLDAVEDIKKALEF